MKLFMCCLLLLPFATMVLTAPVRARRENVISFLNANRNPLSEPVAGKDSEDMSDAKSTESFDTNGFTGPEVSDKNGSESRDAVKSLESHEIMIPKVVVNDNTPSGKTKGVGKDSLEPVYASRRPVQDRGSREATDLDSEEGTTVIAQEDGNLSGKQVLHVSGDKVIDNASQGTDLQGKARRVNGLNSMLAPGQSREMQDWDSAEDNNGRVAAVGNSRETREYISSETYPIATPEHKPVPAKSQALW
ncbi:uncharacterized protein [Trachinotus anak]|uniref:uncharacterized protein isoform X2 n=1 Tax=Trachinotus anak TaxID=443729 RepID=UPI0039F1BDA5